MKKRSKRGVLTDRQRVLNLRRAARQYRQTIKDLRDELRDVRERLAAFEQQQSFRQLYQEINADAYDRCAAEVTREELALFEASPAYQRYQQWRAAKEMRGTDDWRLKVGNWRAP